MILVFRFVAAHLVLHLGAGYVKWKVVFLSLLWK